MSAQPSVPRPGGWLTVLLSGRPHQVIRSSRGSYLHRWFAVPRNRWVNVYVHRFIGSDDAPELHSHPWDFVSLVVHGAYDEVTDSGVRRRRAGSLVRRTASDRHRVELLRDDTGRERPCVSIVVTGPRRHAWGFFCPARDGQWRFIPHQMFSGAGCAEFTPTPTPVGVTRTGQETTR